MRLRGEIIYSAGPPPMGLTPAQVIANADRIFGELSVAGAFVVDFTAAAMSGEGNLVYYEETPAAGTRHQFTPAGMYTDTSIWWIERVRMTGNFVHMHRGGSSVQGGDMRTTLNAGGYGLYVINVTDSEWFANETNNNTGSGGGFINFNQNTPIHTTDLRAMGGKRVIVALIPSLVYDPYA